MNQLEVLFLEKIRILEAFLKCTQGYRDLFDPKGERAAQATPDEKLDWVDALTDERAAHFKMLQLIDQQIEAEKILHPSFTLENLQGGQVIEKIVELIKEIQLTDQSLFLYIQNIGFEIRSQILRGLKEKEAISKFKSQGQGPTGEGLDHKAE